MRNEFFTEFNWTKHALNAWTKWSVAFLLLFVVQTKKSASERVFFSSLHRSFIQIKWKFPRATHHKQKYRRWLVNKCDVQRLFYRFIVLFGTELPTSLNSREIIEIFNGGFFLLTLVLIVTWMHMQRPCQYTKLTVRCKNQNSHGSWTYGYWNGLNEFIFTK